MHLKPFDAGGAFKPVTGGLRRLALRGAAATLVSSFLGLVIQVAATVVLARLLAPADFGLVTMVTTFSLLLANFGFNGFTEAIIQSEELNHGLATNLFWANTGAGVLLTIVFAASGSLLARFYNDPRIQYVTIGVAATIVLSSTWVVHAALLKRAMRFSTASAIDIWARAVSVVVSILLGRAGYGYWALVGGAIALPVATTMGAWSQCRWLPGLPRRVAGTGSMMRFAINVYGRFTVNYCGRNMDNLLVGWRFNAQALGFYKKAYDLFALSAGQLVSPLAHVAVSALSRLREDPVQYRRYLLSALGLVAFVGMGVGADLTLVGHDMIRMLLGPGWEPSGRIFSYFGPGIGIMLVYATHGWIHLSIGRADRWFRWGIVECSFIGLLFLLTLRWGPIGIAASWTASLWILTVPALWYAGKPIDLAIGSVIAVTWKYLAASLLAGFVSAAIVHGSSSIPPSNSVAALVRVVTVSLLFGILYLAAVILLHRSCAPLYQFQRFVCEMFPWARPVKPSVPDSLAGTAAGEAVTLTGSKE